MAKDINSIFFDITPEIEELALKCETNNAIDKELYTKYEVKRGLRDLNGKGVLAGLTNISDVCATKIVDGVSVPCAGNLYYRGYNIKDLVSGFLEAKHFGFEEIAYLLLFGELPNQIVIVRGRAYGHFIWVLTKIVYHLAGDIIVYVHPPQA